MKFSTLTLLTLLSSLMTVAEEDIGLLQAEVRELKTVIRSLRAENEQLLRMNDLLREEVVRLRNTPTPPPSTPQGTPEVREEPAPAEPAMALTATREVEIVYVNPNWHYLIVKRGSDQGLEKGQEGEVRREGQVIGQAKVSDTKPDQAVMNLDTASLQAAGLYPRPGDTVHFP